MNALLQIENRTSSKGLHDTRVTCTPNHRNFSTTVTIRDDDYPNTAPVHGSNSHKKKENVMSKPPNWRTGTEPDSYPVSVTSRATHQKAPYHEPATSQATYHASPYQEDRFSDRYMSKGGLPNLGNTCFANAVIQALYSCSG